MTVALLLERWRERGNKIPSSSRALHRKEECPHCGGMGRLLTASGFIHCGKCAGKGRIETNDLPLDNGKSWRKNPARRAAYLLEYKKRAKSPEPKKPETCHYGCGRKPKTKIRRNVLTLGKMVSRVVPYCGVC